MGFATFWAFPSPSDCPNSAHHVHDPAALPSQLSWLTQGPAPSFLPFTQMNQSLSLCSCLPISRACQTGHQGTACCPPNEQSFPGQWGQATPQVSVTRAASNICQRGVGPGCGSFDPRLLTEPRTPAQAPCRSSTFPSPGPHPSPAAFARAAAHGAGSQRDCTKPSHRPCPGTAGRDSQPGAAPLYNTFL